MRVRKRYAVMLAIAAAIAGVVTFQAVTATPPEPYVRLARGPLSPNGREECRNGQLYTIYTDHTGRDWEPLALNESCEIPSEQ